MKKTWMFMLLAIVCFTGCATSGQVRALDKKSDIFDQNFRKVAEMFSQVQAQNKDLKDKAESSQKEIEDLKKAVAGVENLSNKSADLSINNSKSIVALAEILDPKNARDEKGRFTAAASTVRTKSVNAIYEEPAQILTPEDCGEGCRHCLRQNCTYDNGVQTNPECTMTCQD